MEKKQFLFQAAKCGGVGRGWASDVGGLFTALDFLSRFCLEFLCINIDCKPASEPRARLRMRTAILPNPDRHEGLVLPRVCMYLDEDGPHQLGSLNLLGNVLLILCAVFWSLFFQISGFFILSL